MACTFGRFSVAIIALFRPNDTVDYDSIQRLAKRLMASGCDAVLVSDTTRKAPATHREGERDLLLAVRKAVGSDIKIMTGVSSNDTVHTLAMARVTQDAKTDSLLVYAPYYNRPSQERIYQHFRAVHAESDLPVMVYDIPGRTGVAIEDATLDRLVTLERVRDVKDATANMAGDIARMRRIGLEWYNGNDASNLLFLAERATRVPSVVRHIEGRRIMRLSNAAAAGSLELIRKIDAQLASANRVIMGGGQGATYVKQAVFALGLIDDSHPRLPLAAPGDSEIAAARDSLRAQGLVSAWFRWTQSPLRRVHEVSLMNPS